MSQVKATILTGLSIDGRINFSGSGSSKGFDQGLPQRLINLSDSLRANSDAVMVGINTIINDDPKLRSSANQSLQRVVVDSRLRIPFDARVIGDDPSNLILACGENHDVEKRSALEKIGVQVFQLKGHKVNLSSLISHLSEIGIASLVVEGGGKLNFSLLDQNLVQNLMCVIFPFAIGNVTASSLFDGNGFSGGGVKRLNLIASEALDSGHVLLQYQLIQSE
jgi:diaminohydroxyphosphoribosylaminopyrimidine deaminase/5-amino-6-(5-phosphoribosylamino)uracil reductase